MPLGPIALRLNENELRGEVHAGGTQRTASLLRGMGGWERYHRWYQLLIAKLDIMRV
jgi:hypothetical protein